MSVRFALRQAVELQAIVRSALNGPKMTLQGQSYMYICYLCQRVQYFTPFLSTALRFQADTSDPKITLTLGRPKVPHVSVTNIRESKISASFALQSAVFQ